MLGHKARVVRQGRQGQQGLPESSTAPPATPSAMSSSTTQGDTRRYSPASRTDGEKVHHLLRVREDPGPTRPVERYLYALLVDDEGLARRTENEILRLDAGTGRPPTEGASVIPQRVKNHPAETAGPLAMALAFLIGELVGVDESATVAIAIVLSFVPAIVTWIVNLARGKEAGDA